MSSSYQNGSTAVNGGSSGATPVVPRKIDEIGSSPEEVRRRKANRRLLFTGIGVVLLLSMILLGLGIDIHQREVHNDILLEEDDTKVYKVHSLDTLNAETNTNTNTSTSTNTNTNTSNLVVSGCEATVLLLRHCEKIGAETTDQDGNEHCSYVGFERAHFLPSLFGPAADRGWPIPTSLYALSAKRTDHFNFREIETLVPLAHHYGLDIQSDFETNAEMAHHIVQQLATGAFCGKTIVVSWKHDKLGNLARHLACPNCPVEYPETTFDDVWQLKFVYDVEGTAAIGASRMHSGAPSSSPQQEPQPQPQRRLLKTKKHKKKKRSPPEELPYPPPKTWTVYFALTQQRFDPLQFSASVGDYDGRPSGGKWFAMDEGEM